MDIENLVRQHHDMLLLIEDLEQSQTVEAVKDNAFDLSKTLAHLSGILKMHLSAEDKYLYPKLLKDPDAKICETARSFIREMGEIGEKFTDYKNHYMGASKIADHPEAFLSETRTISLAVRTRMKKEESGLYSLLK